MHILNNISVLHRKMFLKNKNDLRLLVFQVNEIDDRQNYIKDLYSLADEFEVPVPEEDTESYNVNIIVIK